MDQKKISESSADGLQMHEHLASDLGLIGSYDVSMRVTLMDRYGSVKGEDLFTAKDLRNALTDQGANHLFNVYFGATAKAASWYMGLVRGASAADASTPSTPGSNPTAASTLTTIATDEAAIGGNYARLAITWVVYVDGSGTQQTRHAKTGNVVWTANGAWSQGVTHLFLCTAASGTSGIMFNYLQLSATRRPVSSGDTITVSWDGSL